MSDRTGEGRILYVASTASHLRRFHQPYIDALKEENRVFLMADGQNVDFPIPFCKKMLHPKNISCIWKIRGILKREKFDRVILNTSLAAFLVRVAMFGMRKRPYVLNIVHGYLFHEPATGKKDKFLRLCEKFTKGKTDEIAVMNREDVIIAERWHLCKGKVTFLRGMGYTAPDGEPTRNKPLRNELGVADGEILLGFVGELSNRKNQIYLLDAVAKLRESGLTVKLLLLGEGGEHEYLVCTAEKLGISNAVIFAGNQEPVFPWLCAMDIYVSASKIEGLPFNLMEAMAFGLPIIASDVKGQNDLLSDFPFELYSLNDFETFCNKIREVISSRQIGVGSRNYPNLQNYRLESVFQENLDLMRGNDE